MAGRDGRIREPPKMRACLDTLGRPNSVGYFAADPDLRYEPILDMGVFLRVNNIFKEALINSAPSS